MLIGLLFRSIKLLILSGIMAASCQQAIVMPNIEYLVTATFLDIFLIPLRTRLAAAEFEHAKRRVTNEILDLAFEVRQTYYELLGEQQKLKYIRPIV